MMMSSMETTTLPRFLAICDIVDDVVDLGCQLLAYGSNDVRDQFPIVQFPLAHDVSI